MHQKKYFQDDCMVDTEPRFQLAHAYVPYQMLGDVYSPNEALCKGTLFPELWMPYHK